MEISSTPAAAAAAAARLQALESTHEDTREINPTNPASQSYTAGDKKPVSMFRLMYRAFFREEDVVKNNQAVFKQVEEDIRRVYGNDTANAFAATMMSKRSYGSPLTKGALARFLSTQNASTNVIAHKVADAIEALVQNKNYNDTKTRLDNLTSALFSPLTPLPWINQKFSLRVFFSDAEISQIKKSLYNHLSDETHAKNLETLFDSKTSKADRIEILKTVLPKF